MTRFSFIAYGDTRGRFDGVYLQHEHMLVARGMVRAIQQLSTGPDPVKFIVSSGDAVVDGKIADQWNASFVDVVNQIVQAGGVPIFAAPGNHDVTNAMNPADPERAIGLRNYLQAWSNYIPRDGSPRRLSGYPTYTVGYGNTFIILWDSQLSTDTIQFNWIKSQLEGLDKRRYTNIVAVAHHPAFTSGPHGGSVIEPQTLGVRTLIMPLFRKHHVRMLIGGHEHLYEHWVERYEDAGQAYRIDHIISGGGGAPLYPYFGEPETRPYRQAGAAEKVTLEHLVKPSLDPGANPYHYVVVHVDGDKLRLEVIGVDFGSAFAPYRSRSAELSTERRP